MAQEILAHYSPAVLQEALDAAAAREAAPEAPLLAAQAAAGASASASEDEVAEVEEESVDGNKERVSKKRKRASRKPTKVLPQGYARFNNALPACIMYGAGHKKFKGSRHGGVMRG